MYPKNSWFTFFWMISLLVLFNSILIVLLGGIPLWYSIVSGLVVGAASDPVHNIIYKKYGSKSDPQKGDYI